MKMGDLGDLGDLVMMIVWVPIVISGVSDTIYKTNTRGPRFWSGQAIYGDLAT